MSVPVIKTPAEYAFGSIQKQVSAFQNQLAETHEIGISVNGAENLIHVSTIRLGGQMIIFDGRDNFGRLTRLVQHFTQVNIQMTAVEALDEKPRRIGF